MAIGQRALLVTTAEGNLLWDPPGYLDELSVQAVADAGGLRAVTASHPHFYGSMADWSRVFDAEVLLCEADLGWLTRPPERPRRPGRARWRSCPGSPWSSAAAISRAARWPTGPGAGGAGALLSGDFIFVTPGEDRVTFVGNAPNRLPLSERAVRAVAEAVQPYQFDRVYGGWWKPVLRADAKAVVERSAERYIQWLRGEVPRTDDPAGLAAVQRRLNSWSMPYFFIKVAVEDGVPPAFVAWSRVALAAVILLPVAVRRGRCGGWAAAGRPSPPTPPARSAVPFLLIAEGEQRISSSLAAILIASMPLMVALLSVRFSPTTGRPGYGWPGWASASERGRPARGGRRRPAG